MSDSGCEWPSESRGEIGNEVIRLRAELVAMTADRDRHTINAVELMRQRDEMTADRDLWQDAHNEDCPNKAQNVRLQQALETLIDHGVPLRGDGELWGSWQIRVRDRKVAIAVLAETRPNVKET